MNNVNVNPTFTNPTPATSVSYKSTFDSVTNSCFILGLAALYDFLSLSNEMANAKFNNMRAKSDMSRASQEKANIMDSEIAKVNNIKDPNKAKAQVNREVIDFLEKEGIKINGKTPTKFFEDETGKKGDAAFSAPIDKGALAAVKAALEMKANRDSDFVNEAQLQLQKIMQTYNVTTNLVNSMQTMLAEINKTIAQGIR